MHQLFGRRAMLSGKIEKGERRLIGGNGYRSNGHTCIRKGKEGNIRGCVLKFEDDVGTAQGARLHERGQGGC